MIFSIEHVQPEPDEGPDCLRPRLLLLLQRGIDLFFNYSFKDLNFRFFEVGNCCLQCVHRSKRTWVVREMLAFVNRLHLRTAERSYKTLCRFQTRFHGTLIPNPGHE